MVEDHPSINPREIQTEAAAFEIAFTSPPHFKLRLTKPALRRPQYTKGNHVLDVAHVVGQKLITTFFMGHQLLRVDTIHTCIQIESSLRHQTQQSVCTRWVGAQGGGREIEERDNNLTKAAKRREG